MNVFRQMRIPGWLQAFSALPAVLASEVGYTGKTIEQKRLAPDSLMYFVPATLAGSADFPLFCRDHYTPPLLGGEHDVGSFGLRWSYADNFGFLARGENCTNVHVARPIAGVTTHPVPADALMFSVLKVSPANSYCSGTGKRIARIRSVARTVSSRRRISVGAQQSWCSLNP